MSNRTGGACFTPRLAKRPDYPPFHTVFTRALISFVRVSVICALVTIGVAPYYQAVVEACLNAGYSEQTIFAIGLLATHTVTYGLWNGFFALAEAQGWLEQYRFSRKSYQVPQPSLIRRTLTEAGLSQFLTSPIVAWFAYPIMKYFGMPGLTSAIPDFWSLLPFFARAIFINEFFFYWSHRAVHSRSLYAKIHKQHHTYNGTIGMAAEYAHPIEQIVSNQLPTIGGCVFFGAHHLVFCVWLFARLQQTYEGHSGFCFYGTWLHSIGLTNSDAAAYHDYHHSGNRGNFGAEWLDWLGGTMDAWLELGGTEGYIEQCRKYRMDADASTRKRT